MDASPLVAAAEVSVPATVGIAALTALVTQLVAAPLRLFVEGKLHHGRLEADYEYEQRKALRQKIGEYHGRLLQASTSFSYRITNLLNNADQGWLNVHGDYGRRMEDRYYFRTTVCRFMTLMALAARFEREAIFIDSRIAEPTDRLFLFYVKAFRWAMTDTALFKGVSYDVSHASDHFFNDQLLSMCTALPDGGIDFNLRDLHDLLEGEHGLQPVLDYFDGLRPGQLRWDRLMALELLVMSFINNFGYELQYSREPWFRTVARRIERPEVAQSLRDWIPKLGLGDDRQARNIVEALDARLASADV
jgi:hypothetical protein